MSDFRVNSAPLDKMAAYLADDISKCIFMNEKFVQAPNRRQAIAWTDADPIHWHIYAALGGDEF